MKKMMFVLLMGFSGFAQSAEISNAQLTSYSNEVLRPLADKLVDLDQHLKTQIDVYNQRNLGTVINAAGAGNLIDDGSARDGRTRRVGGDVYNLITIMNDLDVFLSSGTRRAVINGWQVNGNN